jgi:hypothetical protein
MLFTYTTPAKVYSIKRQSLQPRLYPSRKPIELATLILKDDKKWISKDYRSHEYGEEKWHTLKNKIPVYIGYFTAWVDDKGEIHFMKTFIIG